MMRQPLIRLLAMLLLSTAITACSSSSHHQPLDASKLEKLAHIHYQLGVDALGKKGMLPKAFNELMESNALLPNQPHVLDALAYAWLLRGDLKKSESSYIKALNYGESASIHNNYANLLNRLKRFDEAEKSARKALDDPRYPNQDLAFINLGNALLGQKKFLQAKQAFQQAKLFNANSYMADLRLADTYFQQGRLHESRLLYEALLRQQNDNRNAVEGLLTVLQQQHDKQQAQVVLKQFSQQTSSAQNKAWALDQFDKLDQLNPSNQFNLPTQLKQPVQANHADQP